MTSHQAWKQQPDTLASQWNLLKSVADATGGEYRESHRNALYTSEMIIGSVKVGPLGSCDLYSAREALIDKIQQWIKVDVPPVAVLHSDPADQAARNTLFSLPYIGAGFVTIKYYDHAVDLYVKGNHLDIHYQGGTLWTCIHNLLRDLKNTNHDLYTRAAGYASRIVPQPLPPTPYPI